MKKVMTLENLLQANSPAVFVRHKFFDENCAEYKFYLDKGYVKYMSNPESADMRSYKEIKQTEIDYTEYLESEETCVQTFQKHKGFKNYQDYMENRPGATAAFGNFGKGVEDLPENIQNEETERRILSSKKFKNKPIMHSIVVSFTEEFSDFANITNRLKMKNVLTNEMDKFFNNNPNWESSNMNWIATFHTNTDNFHSHILIYEREPNQQKFFCKIGKIPLYALEKLRKNIFLKECDSFSNFYKKINEQYLTTKKSAKAGLSEFTKLYKLGQIENENEIFIKMKNVANEINNIKFDNIEINKNQGGRKSYNSANLAKIRESVDNINLEILKSIGNSNVILEIEKLNAMSKKYIDLDKKINTHLALHTIEKQKNKKDDLFEYLGNYLIDFIIKNIKPEKNNYFNSELENENTKNEISGERHDGDPKISKNEISGERHDGDPKISKNEISGERHDGDPKISKNEISGERHDGDPKISKNEIFKKKLNVKKNYNFFNKNKFQYQNFPKSRNRPIYKDSFWIKIKKEAEYAAKNKIFIEKQALQNFGKEIKNG